LKIQQPILSIYIKNTATKKQKPYEKQEKIHNKTKLKTNTPIKNRGV
jgi:hypothetical protein